MLRYTKPAMIKMHNNFYKHGTGKFGSVNYAGFCSDMQSPGFVNTYVLLVE